MAFSALSVRWAVGCLLAANLHFAASAEERLWTSNRGNFQIRARFLRASESTVYLRDPSGVTVAIPKRQLSREDRQRIRQSPQAPIRPEPAAPIASPPPSHLRPAPQPLVKKPQFEIRLVGPRQARVGELLQYRIVVENTGPVPLENLRLAAMVDKTRLSAIQSSWQSTLSMENGQPVWTLPKLSPGASLSPSLVLRAQCKTSGAALVSVRASAHETHVFRELTTTIAETAAPANQPLTPPGAAFFPPVISPPVISPPVISPPPHQPAPLLPAYPSPSEAPAPTLDSDLAVSFVQDFPKRQVGQTANVSVFVKNLGSEVMENIRLRVELDKGLRNAKKGESVWEKELPDIAAGAAEHVLLTFRVSAPGKLRYRLLASGDAGNMKHAANVENWVEGEESTAGVPALHAPQGVFPPKDVQAPSASAANTRKSPGGEASFFAKEPGTWPLIEPALGFPWVPKSTEISQAFSFLPERLQGSLAEDQSFWSSTREITYRLELHNQRFVSDGPIEIGFKLPSGMQFVRFSSHRPPTNVNGSSLRYRIEGLEALESLEPPLTFRVKAPEKGVYHLRAKISSRNEPGGVAISQRTSIGQE